MKYFSNLHFKFIVLFFLFTLFGCQQMDSHYLGNLEPVKPVNLLQNYDNSQSPLGVNLQGVRDWSSELVFLDYIKRMRPWVSQQEGRNWGEGDPLDMDEQGWIRSLNPGQTADMYLGTNYHYEEGTYYVFFDGEGTIRCNNWGEVNQSGQTFTIPPETNAGHFALTLRETNPSDYMRNIRIIHEDQLDRYDGGEIFYGTFLQNWSYYGTLRFMDWGHTNNSEVTTWDSRVQSNDMNYYPAVPVEIQVRLANELGAKPWFCMPHLADDDYIRQHARYVRDNLSPDLDIYLEHSNEVWNFIFVQYHYAQQQGISMGLGYFDEDSTEPNEFYAVLQYHALRTAEIVQIWEEEFGSGDRLIGVYAVGGPAEWMLTRGMEYLQELGMDHYIKAAGLAPYVGSQGEYSTVNGAINVLFSEMGDDEGYRARVREVFTAAENFNLRLVAYEGGQHLWNFGQDFTEVGELAQSDPRMYSWVKEYMDIWREEGGQEFMIFGSGGGFWGQIPWGMEPLAAPKYRAHYDFIMENPIWWQE